MENNTIQAINGQSNNQPGVRFGGGGGVGGGGGGAGWMRATIYLTMLNMMQKGIFVITR